MSRKAKRRDADTSVRPPAFRVDPFAGLRVQAAAPARPAPAPPPPEPPRVRLDAEDRKLLEAFKGAGAIEFGAPPEVQPASAVRVPRSRAAAHEDAPTHRGGLAALPGGPAPGTAGAPQVRLGLVRRRGGRSLTTVRGLRALSVLELMEVTAALRRQFGMVARFRENVLEVEGDQRSRLGAWLAAQGYAVPDADREG